MAQCAYSSSNANRNELEGMVSDVRGLPQATVAVTLFNNDKVYPLQQNSGLEKIYNSYNNQISDINCQNSYTNCDRCRGANHMCPGLSRGTDFNKPGTVSKSSETDPVPWNTVCRSHRNNSAQALDGRYASTYQVNHCRVTPTSPQHFLSEFPPQRLQPDRVPFTKNGYPARNSWNGDLKYGTNFVTSTYWQDMVTQEPVKHLRNTNWKNYKEKEKLRSKPSNSLSSLENDTHNLSKNIQTYTRIVYQGQEDIEDIDEEAYGVEKEIRNDIIYKDSQLSPAFDHMRCDEKKPPLWMHEGIFSRDMDIRHLADVTKCIRDRIRFFCGEDPQPTESNVCGERDGCPRLAERFMRHQLECSGLIQPRSDAVDTEVQAAARRCEKEVSTSCNREPIKLSVSIPRLCQCKTLKSKVFPCPKCRIANLINAKIRREIQNWHGKVPVSAHEKQEDKVKRHRMMDVLAERVIEMADILEGDDLKTYVRKEVKTFMRELPMWSSDSKCCDNSLKEKMSNSLAESLCKIIRKKPDILDETISDWLKAIPIRKESEQAFDKKTLQGELKKRIREVFNNRPSCDAYFRNALAEKIENTLEPCLSDFDDVCNKSRYIMAMSEQLADLVKDLTSEYKSNENNEIKNKIEDWIEKHPDLFKHGVDQDAVDALSNTLMSVLHEDSTRINEVQDEITQWLSLHTTKVPDKQSVSRFAKILLPRATSTPRESADATVYSNFDVGSGSLVDDVQNILNKSGLSLRPEVQKRLALDIVGVLAASPEEVCAGNDNNLQIIQSLLQEESFASEEQTSRVAHEIIVLAEVHAEMTEITNDNSSPLQNSEKKLCYTVTENSRRDSKCAQSSRELLEESVHEVFEECNIHPNNENETIRNLVDIMESINSDCDEPCFERSFQKQVLPEVSKLLSQCSQCSPNKVKLNTTVDELRARFQEIKNRAARRPCTNVAPSESNAHENESKSIKIKITQWADELPLKAEPKIEVKRAKDNMINELSEEISGLQNQQVKEKMQPSRYQQKIREKVTPWLKKLPLQPVGQTNTEKMADELVNRVTMPSQCVETSGGLNQAQWENTVMNWFKNSNFYRKITAEERRRQIQIVPQLASQLKEIQAGFLNASLDDPVLNNKMREKIIDFLKDLRIVDECCLNEKSYQDAANELLSQMAYGEKSDLNHTVMDENEVFENIVSEWIANLPLPERLEFEDIQKHNDLKDQFMKQISHMRENPEKFSENAMRGEIIRLMSIFPIADNKKRDRRFLYSQATDLIERLRAVPYNPESKTNFNKYLALLKREVAMWIDEFPVVYADIDGEEAHKNKAAGQLADKIFMIQMRHPNENDQEIYEEELYETISRWLTALNRPKIDSNKHRLSVRLIIRINDLESRMANAVMQSVPLKPYKERYLENIAAGAVPLQFINKEEEKMHQEIINNMANAFINRNYKLEDPQQRADLIEALCAHIRDFLDYVETLSDEQTNYDALRTELEEVLKQVPVPNLEKARREQIIKHTWKVVTAWYKSLPVEPAADPEEEMDRVRMLNYLNTKMAKIRKNFEVSCEEGNWDERMVKEIFNFLKTLPLYRSDCSALNEFADNLITSYLDAERYLSQSLSQRNNEGHPFDDELPQGNFKVGGPCGKKREEKKPPKTVPQKEMHDKNIVQQTSDPSLINRTADQVNFHRPKELLDKTPPASAPPECPVACRPHTMTPQPGTQGEYVSYYDPAFVDERFLDDSLENYGSFKQKAQFSSSIMPQQDQLSKAIESCKGCSKSNEQTFKTAKFPNASTTTPKIPQSTKTSQYHKSCTHPTEKEDQAISGSFRSGRHSPKSPTQGVRQRTHSPKTNSDSFGVKGISLKMKSTDENQYNDSECPMMSVEKYLPAHHTSQVSESDRYRCGQTRFRDHYDGPQSVPTRTADRAISATLQREIDLARQIGMYDEPSAVGHGQRISARSPRGAGSAEDRRQGPCVPMGAQDGLQPSSADDIPVYCPCIQKLLNCRSLGFFFRPSCPSITGDEAVLQCPRCCNMCPCANFANFKPPCP